MIEFTPEGVHHVKVTRNGIQIGWITRTKRRTVGPGAETVIRWEARIEGHHFDDARLCIVRQQIREILTDRPIEVTPSGLTALQQAKLIFSAATKTTVN